MQVRFHCALRYARYGGNFVDRLSVDELQRYACAFVRFQRGESLQYVHPQCAVVIAGMACRNRGLSRLVENKAAEWKKIF